eukprot:PLAT15901.1.p1 GENE.PLAT15901.1~~PLAT15901.1.p1  ORF type:complete len:140 (+),score=61.87 PLAT15901.1:61-420(+)
MAAPCAADSAAAVFQQLGEGLASHPEVVKKVKGVFRWVITGSGGKSYWTIDLKNGAGSVSEGKDGKADVTITVSEDNFLGLMAGRLNPQKLFMSGKLKMKGKMALAMKLGELTKMQSKL